MNIREAKQFTRSLLDKIEFDVSKYERCAELSACQWAQLLSFRRDHRELELGVEKAINAVENGGSNRGLEVLLHLMDNPVPPDLPIWGARKWQSVYDAEIYTIWEGREAIARHLPEAKLACEQEDARDADENSESPDLAYKSLHSHMLENRSGRWREKNILVGVDLSAPDEVIKKQFSLWLRRKRQEVDQLTGFTPPSKFSEADFRQWHRLRILAFLDLEMFAYHLDLNLTDEMIGQRLFPDEYDVGIGERIRKTVRPLAARLTSSETLDALQFQAGVEYWQRQAEEN
jgi:hypothetical protein